MADSLPDTRPIEFYLKNGRGLLSLQNPLVFFCDSDTKPHIEKLRNELAPGQPTVYIEQSLLDYEFYTHNWSIIQKNRESGGYFQDGKNTSSYFILTVFKIVSLYIASQKNYFNTTHYAWLDFGLSYIAPIDFEKSALQLLQAPHPKVGVCYIHYRTHEHLEDMTAYCTTCSCGIAAGVITVEHPYMAKFYTSMMSIFYEQLAKGIGHTEEQILTYCYDRHPELFTLYYGDYYSLLTNYHMIRYDWECIKPNYLQNVISAKKPNLIQDVAEKILESIDNGLQIPSEDIEFVQSLVQKEKKELTIGVCIPCHSPKIQYLQQCLDSIENQTRKPTHVCVSISGTSETPDLPTYSFPIKIVVTAANQCAGKNRMVSAAELSAMDILTFFDADDIMHARRIEIILQHFSESSIDGYIHNHKYCMRDDYIHLPLKDIEWDYTGAILHTDGFSDTLEDTCGKIHSIYGGGTGGHFSCRSSILKTIQYSENYGKGEDWDFIYRIYKQGYKLGYCSDKLSYYLNDPPSIESNPQAVYTTYQNSEIQNLIKYLQSDNAPKRENPIYIIDSINIYADNTEKKILYNIEQLTREKILQQCVPRMKADDVVEVWDYSMANVSILRNYGIRARHVPMRLSIDTILHYSNYRLQPEYDIVFCGELSEYRDTILRQLEQRGKSVKRIDSIYNEERDRLIGKAKLLINIHYNENYRIFESIRCEPWIASGMKVLSETSIDDSSRCICVPYEELVDKACELTNQ